MDNCIFCKIVKGELPSFKVWEDDKHLAFLSIAPLMPGHTLVIPKEHSDYIFDMNDVALGELLQACKPVAVKLKKGIQPKTGKIGIMVAGLQVPHIHVHLVPMDEEGDLDFSKAKQSTEEELKKIQEKIVSAE